MEICVCSNSSGDVPPGEEAGMNKRLLVLGLIGYLFVMGNPCWAQLYKWVDEKGTIHFSDDPPPAALKTQAKDQAKGQVKTQDGNQEKNQVKNQKGNPEKQAVREADTLAILKRLEMGNRYIPDDMKKYGPGGGYEGPQGGGEQTVSSPSVRRSSS
jgi:hypothetical protein